ncbi:TonB-dependent receptor domain-containing protein [Coralloluteibacterium stylophorae]|uniref:TonB-dependent receptor n=1 Tax=Coralloluteibacterium stylophorae TaxID=1776034 RepID=A0A8J7VS07_9GAMM|nr:TonB-dependent receptor [Coralloluteibacterium stylophorae]MBS7455775.1 TonB-dependent receptor [Coralloluteibacterium stylophorae]
MTLQQTLTLPPGILAAALSAVFTAPATAVADESAVVLPQTVVTATATPRALANVPASVTVIDREELERRPVADLADALRGTPGVTLTGVGFGRRGIRIRGMSSDYTLTLIDGRRITPSAGAVAHSDFDLGWVPVEAIERIEVVRGPMSSLYGSEALGGVVNIVTRSSTDAWKGSVLLNGGVRDDGRGGENHQAAFYAGGPLLPGVLGISVYGEERRREDMPSAANSAVSDQEGRDGRSGRVTLSWTPDEAQRIDLDVLRGRESRWRGAEQAGARPYTYLWGDDIQRRQDSLTHRGTWGWGDTQVRAYRTVLDRQNRRSQGTVSAPQTLREDTFDARATADLGARHRVSVGGEWRDERLTDQSVDADGFARMQHRAVFAQDEVTLGRAWSLVVGDRLDDHEVFGTHHSPRAYVVATPSADWTIKGGVGRGFKAPTLKQLSPEYSAVAGGGMFTILGNPDLQPEVGTTFELGTEHTQGPWTLQATAFHNDLRDLIQTICIAACGIRGSDTRTYVNVEEAEIRGVELTAGLDLSAQWRFDANYTWLDGRDVSNDRELAERARHSGYAALEWRPVDAFDARVRGEYVGSQVQYSGDTAVGLDPYLLWSLDLRYRATDALTLRGGVENLTDELREDTAALYPYPETGRAYSVGLIYSF